MSPADDKMREELACLREEVKQLRKKLNQLTPGLETLLNRRGFRIYRKEPVESVLIPAKRHLGRYYLMLNKYSFRLFLRDVIKQQEMFTVESLTNYATAEVTNSYIDMLRSFKLIRKKGSGFVLLKHPVRSFGETLEWYVAEMLRREFEMESVWGVKFKRPKVGGDYDVVAKFDGSLLYLEVKSSPPKQIYDSEVAAFLERVDDLSPAIAVFLMDTELRMKDKIVPMFEKALAGRYRTPPGVTRMERELFQIENRIFIVNAKEEILHNMRKVLYWHYRREGRSRGEG